MKTFVASLLAVAASASLKAKYMSYVIEHSKSYLTSDEFAVHEAHFIETEKFINEHQLTNASFSVAHNKFSDMTEEQKARYRGRLPRNGRKVTTPELLSTENLPTSIDWRTLGAVNPIQDQGQCGSCWAFSSVASLEGAHFIATGELQKFSEQQLVDCAGFRWGNYGCNGGLEDNAFRYYESNDAILESDYGYTARDGSCQYSSLPHTSIEVQKYQDIAADSSSQTLAAIAKQVTSVAIEADQRVFQYYKTGIFDSTQCGTNLDHAVALVGFGSAGGQDYYILRNSWGTSWGENGYMRIANTGDGVGICGVQMEPVIPTSN